MTKEMKMKKMKKNKNKNDLHMDKKQTRIL